MLCEEESGMSEACVGRKFGREGGREEVWEFVESIFPFFSFFLLGSFGSFGSFGGFGGCEKGDTSKRYGTFWGIPPPKRYGTFRGFPPSHSLIILFPEE